MPKSSKKILCICGSRSIDYIDIDRYLDYNDFGEIVCGGATGVDTLAEAWAKKHGLEFLAFLPNYEAYGHKKAPLIRDREMVEFCDCVVGFWDGKSTETLYTIAYAAQYGVPYRLHVIEDL